MLAAGPTPLWLAPLALRLCLPLSARRRSGSGTEMHSGDKRTRL